MIEPLLNAAKQTGYCPLIAEALLADAHAIGRGWTPDPTYRARLEEALWEAESCGHDRIVAITAAELVFADRFKPETASSWARMADSVLSRLGGDVGVESWLQNNRALAANAQGRYDEAIEAYRSALELKRRDVGSSHLEYAVRLVNLSDALKGAGKLDEALRISDEALTVLERWLGPDHLDTGIAQSNRGDLLVALNRIKDAEVAYRVALGIFKTKLPTGDSRIAYPLAGMGTALLAEGDSHGAREMLEEAERTNVGGDAYLAADIKFALAKALMADGGDHRLAMSFAYSAAKAYAENQHFLERQKEIRLWIASEHVAAADGGASSHKRRGRDD
jgi:tetratricopeptide (TPR) repeat protein